MKKYDEQNMYGIKAENDEEKMIVLLGLLTMPWGGLKEISFYKDKLFQNPIPDAIFQQVPESITFYSDEKHTLMEFFAALDNSTGYAVGVGEDEDGERYSFSIMPELKSVIVNFVGDVDRDAFWNAYDEHMANAADWD